MADLDRRNGSYRGGHNNRKRRFREDDDSDRRPQRRRYEEPAHIKLRKQLLSLSDSPAKRAEDEITIVAKAATQGYEDEQLRTTFLDLTLLMVIEQPLKIPYIAALALLVNQQKQELAGDLIERIGDKIQEHLQAGAWREVKLFLRLLASVQGMLTGDGVFPILDELFGRAVDLQTASTEDVSSVDLPGITGS